MKHHNQILELSKYKICSNRGRIQREREIITSSSCSTSFKISKFFSGKRPKGFHSPKKKGETCKIPKFKSERTKNQQISLTTGVQLRIPPKHELRNLRKLPDQLRLVRDPALALLSPIRAASNSQKIRASRDPSLTPPRRPGAARWHFRSKFHSVEALGPPQRVDRTDTGAVSDPCTVGI